MAGRRSRASWQPHGVTSRTPAQQVALATRILDNRHIGDVADRIALHFGERRYVIGQPDLARNLLADWVQRLGIARRRPPFVDGLDPALAAIIGDHSASTTIDRYATIGGAPMATEHVKAADKVQRYELGAGYGGVLLAWSDRSQRMGLDVIRPVDLHLEYAGNDPTEPTVIEHRGIRDVDGRPTKVIDCYDLTDLEDPSYRVLTDDDSRADVTGKVHTDDLSGDAYPWRYSDGTPFHRIVIYGDPFAPFGTQPLVEGTLTTSARWTAWGAGVTDGGFPQRGTIGLRLQGENSAMDSRELNLATGPETVLNYRSVDPERPGSQFQWGPGYDPVAMAKSIRLYETALLSGLGLPVDLESTGGEPTRTEQEQIAELVAATYPEARRFDSELIRRCAAIANRRDEIAGDFDETPYGVLYRDEITEALRGGEQELDVAKTALNGAQVQSAAGIVSSASRGEIPRESGINMLVQFFQLTTADAAMVMADAGSGFEPTTGAEGADIEEGEE